MMKNQIKNQRGRQKPKQKIKAEVKLPQWLVWLYALASFVLIPAYYYKPAVDVTLVPKFMVLSGLLLFFVLVFLIFGKYKIPLVTLFRRWPVRLWAGFVVVSALSLTAAINPQEGVFDIMKVTISLLYLLITTIILIRSDSIKPFVISAILLTIGFACIGFYQYFTFAYSQADLSMLYKVNGLMSHKNVFSVILFLAFPLLFYSVFTNKSIERIFSLIALATGFVILFLLQTRSVWLAIFVFILVSVCLALYSRKKVIAPAAKFMSQSALLIVSVIIFSFFIAFGVNRSSVRKQVKISEYQSYEKVENLDKRVASIFDTSSPNRVKRLDIWERTLEMVADHPVLGIGAGNWKIIAPDYYQPDPDEAYYHNWRRPHNDFIWVMAEKGVAGFILYLGFFLSIMFISIRVIRKSENAGQIILTIAGLAGIAGYCVDASFSFPYERVDIQMFMMFYVSVILWAGIKSAPQQEVPDVAKLKRLNRAFLIFSGLILVIGISIGQKMVKAEKYVNYAHNAVTTQQWELAIRAIDMGYNYWAQLDPVNNPMYWYRGHANLNLRKPEEAREDLNRALQHNPNSVPALTDLATVYYLQNDFEKALEYFTEAIRIYPMNRHALRLLGLTYLSLDRYDEAAQNLYRCKTDQPNPELDTLIYQVHLKMREAEEQTSK